MCICVCLCVCVCVCVCECMFASKYLLLEVMNWLMMENVRIIQDVVEQWIH